jgi:transposase-like protein
MAEDRGNKPVTREFLSERDARIFKMRQAGTSIQEIARRFGVSSGVVSNAVKRQLEKLNKEAMLAYPEVLRMELERLDNLQQAIWPLTQHRKVRMDDGSEVSVEPDMKAIQQVLSIMDRRTKLLGMDHVNLNVQMDANMSSSDPVKVTLAGATAKGETEKFDPESEARKLLELMGASGILPPEMIRQLLSGGDIIDADVVEIEDEEDEEEILSIENREQ